MAQSTISRVVTQKLHRYNHSCQHEQGHFTHDYIDCFQKIPNSLKFTLKNC